MSTGKRLGLFPFLDTRLKAILARAGFHAAAPPGSGPPREAWSPEV